ncbi:MAG: S1C family serine protease [Planctomycetales bacterium]|nr:S1C family serine protease [Planctomycetales bacterium]
MRRRGLPVLPILLGGALAAAPAPPARAQERVPNRTQLLRRAFGDVAERHADGVARVVVSGDEKGFGVLVTGEGHVLAPSALVPAGARVAVAFGGADSYPAEVVARNEPLNLVLLLAEPEELVTPISFRNPVDPEVGRFAISVGTGPSPVAVGAVSAVNRAVPEGDKQELPPEAMFVPHPAQTIRAGRRYDNVLQHDSWLGNTLADRSLGAPLFDVRGRILGITVEVRSRGTCYAIPAKLVRDALPALLAGKTTPAVRPGFFGVQTDELLPEEAKRLRIPAGVRVSAVVPGPGEQPIGAAKAGIRPGDVILAVNGVAASDTGTLQEIVQSFRPGDRVPVELVREGGERARVEVEVAERPLEFGPPSPPDSPRRRR